MLISELIKEFEQKKEKYGDVEVRYPVWDRDYNDNIYLDWEDIDSVYYFEEYDGYKNFVGLD